MAVRLPSLGGVEMWVNCAELASGWRNVRSWLAVGSEVVLTGVLKGPVIDYRELREKVAL